MSDTRWKAERPAQRLPWWAAIAFDKRFWLKVWPRGDCWEWRGYVMPEGYGQAQDANGHITTAHRIAYELAEGIVAAGASCPTISVGIGGVFVRATSRR